MRYFNMSHYKSILNRISSKYSVALRIVVKKNLDL